MPKKKIQAFYKSKTILNPEPKNWCHANNFSIWGGREYGDCERENGRITVFIEDKDFDNQETAMLNPPTSS